MCTLVKYIFEKSLYMPVKEEDNIQLRVGILLMTSHAVFSDNDRRNDPQD